MKIIQITNTVQCCGYPHVAIVEAMQLVDEGLVISACAMDISHELGHDDVKLAAHPGATVLSHAYHYLYECTPGSRCIHGEC